jgi:hypothetical protein
MQLQISLNKTSDLLCPNLPLLEAVCVSVSVCARVCLLMCVWERERVTYKNSNNFNKWVSVEMDFNIICASSYKMTFLSTLVA